jgi:hypothetical protein
VELAATRNATNQEEKRCQVADAEELAAADEPESSKPPEECEDGPASHQGGNEHDEEALSIDKPRANVSRMSRARAPEEGVVAQHVDRRDSVRSVRHG